MKNNEPAFPVYLKGGCFAFAAGEYPGMTLRDWFAGQALQGLLNRQHLSVPVCPRCKTVADDPGEHYSEIAYLYADAMLAAREKSEVKNEKI